MTQSQSSQPAGGEQRLYSRSGFPEIYERTLVGPIFAPWVEPLLEDVQLGPGDRVLDVACGTGIVARLVKERPGAGGGVVGVDLNPRMLAVARRVAPTIATSLAMWYWPEFGRGHGPTAPGDPHASAR